MQSPDRPSERLGRSERQVRLKCQGKVQLTMTWVGGGLFVLCFCERCRCEFVMCKINPKLNKSIHGHTTRHCMDKCIIFNDRRSF